MSILKAKYLGIIANEIYIANGKPGITFFFDTEVGLDKDIFLHIDYIDQLLEKGKITFFHDFVDVVVIKVTIHNETYARTLLMYENK